MPSEQNFNVSDVACTVGEDTYVEIFDELSSKDESTCESKCLEKCSVNDNPYFDACPGGGSGANALVGVNASPIIVAMSAMMVAAFA